MRYIIIALLSLVSMTAIAHQPDISTTMLVEKEDGQWMVVLRASLTAFQHEVRYTYGEDSYKSPEAFHELVKAHLRKHVNIQFNSLPTCTFGQIDVKLGHETSVTMELIGAASNVSDLKVKNSAFMDIHKNQSALIVLKEGFLKSQFIMTNDNDHTIQLKAENNEFISIGNEIDESINLSTSFMIIGTIGILFIGFALYILRIKR